MLLLLIACNSPVDCKAGFTAGDDGYCYEDGDAPAADDTGDTDTPEVEPPTLDDVLDALPPCELTSTDGRIDLYSGCADGVCPGATYDAAVEALGEEPDCYGFYYEIDTYVGGSLSCTWSNGIQLDFDDLDQDGVADVGSATYGVDLDETYDGGTTEGLGIGATMRCFVEALGQPDYVSFELLDKDWYLRYAGWSVDGVYVDDRYDPWGNYQPDGYVDGITLYGSDAEL